MLFEGTVSPPACNAGESSESQEFFQRAVAIDPEYAAAYSGLAEYYYSLMSFGLKQVGEVAPAIRWASERALTIDAANGEAHSMLATLAVFSDFDWKLAEKHCLMALEAEPVPGTARLRYALYCLLPLGRISEATIQSRLAIESDPLSMLLHFGVTWCLYSAKLYTEAIEYSRTALEIDPNYWPVLLAMGSAQIHAGLIREAITTLERVVELVPWYSLGVAALAIAYHEAGDRESARKWAEKLVGNSGAAFYYAAIGEVDLMFQALLVLCEQRDRAIFFLQNSAFFDPYRGDARFLSLLKQMNLA